VYCYGTTSGNSKRATSALDQLEALDMTGAPLAMSIEAINWALKDAPGVPPQCVAVLFGLADAADKHGRGAYLGQSTLAGYARKSDRSVRNDLTLLLELGIIRKGDQGCAAHIAADARPVVYDLNMERKPASARKHSSARKPSSARQPASAAQDTLSDLEEQGGSGSTLPDGSLVPAGSTASRERKPASDNPSTNQNHQVPSEPAEHESRHAVADELTDAYWKVHKSATAQSFITIRGIVRTAIANGLPRNDVAKALDRLAREGKAISGGAITNALPRAPGTNGSGPSGAPGPDRARGWMAAGRAHQENADEAQREITS
jgi:hypothetical protein